MKIHYLEVVTTDVEAAVSLYSKIYNLQEDAFKTSPELGNARTVELVDSSTTLGIYVNQCTMPRNQLYGHTHLLMI